MKCAHIEAGLRSRDMTMPEEINRLVTDRLSDLLFTPDRLSGDNLRQEGVPEERIRFVGNIMIDTLEAQREKALKLDPEAIVRSALLPGQAELNAENKTSLQGGKFAVMTLHRKAYRETLTLKRKPNRPELWDGKTAGRIVAALSG